MTGCRREEARFISGKNQLNRLEAGIKTEIAANDGSTVER